VIEWGKKIKNFGLWWHGRAKLLVLASNFFFFFRIIFGQIPAKQIKITQNKSNKTRGLPPTKSSFKVISLTIKRFLFLNLGYVDHCVKIMLKNILSHDDQSHQSYSMNQK